MRLAIHHKIAFKFAAPQKSILQILRLQPRPYESQSLSPWRISVDRDCRLAQSEDSFYNVTHTLQAEEAASALEICAEGIANTFDSAGVVRQSAEHFSPKFYLRDTESTHACPDLREFAQTAAAEAQDMLDRLHHLLRAVHAKIDFTPDEPFARSAKETFEGESGNAFELAHVFIACARALGVPARCVSGYVHRHLEEQNETYTGFHGWAECYVEKIGWIAFDPAFCICADQGYVRLACGLDELYVRPVRFLAPIGTEQKHKVTVAGTVAELSAPNPYQAQNGQGQSQSQS